MQTRPTSWWRRGALVVLLVILGLGFVPSGSATAATVDAEDYGPRRADRTQPATPDDGPRTQIVGGEVAPPGSYPSQAAIVLRPFSAEQGQICGGTVIDRNWILTAAHCVYDPSTDWYPTPSDLDVVVGTQDLRVGGTRIRSVEFRIHPGWDRSRLINDIALIRLDKPVPTNVPVQALAPAGPAPAPGSIETAVGWGDLADSSGTYPPDLRRVNLVAQSDSTCSNAFGPIYNANGMICAFAQNRGTCQGDSGGGVLSGGVQVGVVSWGAVCAEYPSVFARVSAYSTWIRWQVRYGPQPNATAFVKRQYLDLFGRQPTNAELFYGVAGLEDGQSTAAYVAGLLDGPTYRARSGGVARLYEAVFLRTPDTGGMAYWMGEINRGVALKRIAELMVRAQEFVDRYGALDDTGFVDLVYENVLNREPTQDDLDFWVGELASGRRTRGQVMVGFSESPEFKTATDPKTRVIGAFHALVRRVPSPTELSTWTGQSTTNIARFLLTSYTYANRF